MSVHLKVMRQCQVWSCRQLRQQLRQQTPAVNRCADDAHALLSQGLFETAIARLEAVASRLEVAEVITAFEQVAVSLRASTLTCAATALSRYWTSLTFEGVTELNRF